MERIDYKSFSFQSAKAVSDEIETVICPETNIELYFKTSIGDVYPFESFGDCQECGVSFHVSALYNSANISPSEWPVHYLGRYCKNCFLKEDEALKLTQEEVKALQVEDEEEE